MDTGSHEHCFCSLNTAGEPMCCKCGTTHPGKFIDFEAFLIEQQYKHNTRKEADNAPDTE